MFTRFQDPCQGFEVLKISIGRCTATLGANFGRTDEAPAFTVPGGGTPVHIRIQRADRGGRKECLLLKFTCGKVEQLIRSVHWHTQ
jgi:hypothetical protein